MVTFEGNVYLKMLELHYVKLTNTGNYMLMNLDFFACKKPHNGDLTKPDLRKFWGFLHAKKSKFITIKNMYIAHMIYDRFLCISLVI